MRHYDAVIVGAGPAGLSAALEVGSRGADTLLVDRQDRLGGQLIKQTHKFFGSKDEHAGTRGIAIATELALAVTALGNVDIRLNTTALGYYLDRVLTYDTQDQYGKVHCDNLVIATGASEKMLPFPNNDLPGVYGAGAVQTLMNVHGVLPAKRVLMVGAGNIGLIVSYQLRQAGVDVAAVVEAAPQIGGYAVHASKIRRLGIPILTSHSVKAAHGRCSVTGATIWQLDASWRGIPGTEQHIECDAICLATGLTPLVELLWHAGCELRYIPELGGNVPATSDLLETSVPGIWVAGDAGGVEEASAAMITGRLAGLGASARLGLCPEYGTESRALLSRLAMLRAGPTGAKIRSGLQKLRGEGSPCHS